MYASMNLIMYAYMHPCMCAYVLCMYVSMYAYACIYAFIHIRSAFTMLYSRVPLQAHKNVEYMNLCVKYWVNKKITTRLYEVGTRNLYQFQPYVYNLCPTVHFLLCFCNLIINSDKFESNCSSFILVHGLFGLILVVEAK